MDPFLNRAESQTPCRVVQYGTALLIIVETVGYLQWRVKVLRFEQRTGSSGILTWPVFQLYSPWFCRIKLWRFFVFFFPSLSFLKSGGLHPKQRLLVSRSSAGRHLDIFMNVCERQSRNKSFNSHRNTRRNTLKRRILFFYYLLKVDFQDRKAAQKRQQSGCVRHTGPFPASSALILGFHCFHFFSLFLKHLWIYFGF